MKFPAKSVGRGWSRRRLLGLGAAGLLAVVLALALLRPFADARAALRSGHYEVARVALLDAAEGGDLWAQNALGNLYYLGLGTEPDYEQAAAWYWSAASQGYAEAQMNMGHLYAQGFGMPQDWIRAYAWYQLAAQGHENARHMVWLIEGQKHMHMTPSQIQRAWEAYRTVESLRP